MDDDMPEATAVSLPDDLISDILSRTPLKPVCRFRCVSRGWNGLISSPAFLAAHKSRHTDPFLVDTGRFRGNEKPDLRLMDMDGNVVRVLEGVGGSGMFSTTSLDNLVCVWGGSCDHHGAEPCEAVRVVDPATGEVLFTSPGHKVIHSNIIEYCQNFSIGRAIPSGVYKVVRPGLSNFCDVLTLGENRRRWRTKTKHPSAPNYVLDYSSSPVTINGVMYFFAGRLSDLALLCFDLERERWKADAIVGPQTVIGADIWRTSTKSVHMTELNGSLCMIQEERIDGHSCSNIWILDDSDRNNWSKLCTIPIGSFRRCCVPLRRMQDGEKLLVQCGTTYMRSSMALQVYDPRIETFSNITGEPGHLPSNITLCNLHLEHLVLGRNYFTVV